MIRRLADLAFTPLAWLIYQAANSRTAERVAERLHPARWANITDDEEAR